MAEGERKVTLYGDGTEPGPLFSESPHATIRQAAENYYAEALNGEAIYIRVPSGEFYIWHNQESPDGLIFEAQVVRINIITSSEASTSSLVAYASRAASEFTKIAARNMVNKILGG